MSLEQKIEELTEAVELLAITIMKFPEVAKSGQSIDFASLVSGQASEQVEEETTTEQAKPAAKGKTKTAAASADSAGSTSAKETSAPSQEHPGAQTGKGVTVEELRAAAASAAKKDRAATMAAVNKYAPGVSQVAEEDRPALLKELEKI